MKQVMKWAVIRSFLDRYTGRALNSVFMIRKHSSISQRLLLIAMMEGMDDSRLVQTKYSPSYLASSSIWHWSRHVVVLVASSPSGVQCCCRMKRFGSLAFFLLQSLKILRLCRAARVSGTKAWFTTKPACPERRKFTG